MAMILSCLKCLRIFSSLRVRLALVTTSKALGIFLIATCWPEEQEKGIYIPGDTLQQLQAPSDTTLLEPKEQQVRLYYVQDPVCNIKF